MYHYSNSRANNNIDEPVYLTKFRTTWVLPAPLQSKYGTDIISQQVKSIKGLNTEKLPGLVEQKYRYYKREFIGTVVDDTSIDIDIEFETNVDKDGIIYPLNIFRDWQHLCWDPSSGLQSLKRDYVGSLTVDFHEKNGRIIRRIYVPIIFPAEPVPQFEGDYASEAIYSGTMKFKGENPKDIVIQK